MEKFNKYQKIIIASILLIVGMATAVFGRNMAIQLGATCLCWGLAVLSVAWSTKQRNDNELEQFEQEANAILTDIATYGEESEYYGTIDIAGANKMRSKLIKKNKKQAVGCVVLGVVLIITGILCML